MLESAQFAEVADFIEATVGGTALCRRRYRIATSGASEDVLTGPTKVVNLELPFAAVDVDVTCEVGSILTWTTEAHPYSLLVTVLLTDDPSIELQVFVVHYRWPGFLPHREERRYDVLLAVQHTFATTYSLVLTCEQPGVIDDPVVRIQPDTFALPTPQATDETIILAPRAIPPGQRLLIRILKGATPRRHPLLTALSHELSSGAPFHGLTVVFIQHLLGDFVGLLNAFQDLGLSKEDTFVLGIPYSTKSFVVEEVTTMTVNEVIAPAEYPIDARVRDLLGRVYEHCAQNNTRYLIVEDGGYAALQLRDHEMGSLWAERCIGIVEQTRNGIRVTKEWVEGEVHLGPLTVPILNVAESPFKLEEEPKLIGTAIVTNLRHLLQVYGRDDLEGMRVLLIGGRGTVGQFVDSKLTQAGCEVLVFDTKERIDAHGEIEPAPELPKTLADFLAGRDMVIGITGNGKGVPERHSNPPLGTAEHFDRLDDRVVLVNASSKLCEFDWDEIEMRTEIRRTRRGFGEERVLTGGKTLRIAANGFPVNFYGSESVPAAKIQPVLALLLLGAVTLASGKISPGLHPFPPEEHDRMMIAHDQLSRGSTD
jgi:S-adenosylhomocysteine hydrolase